MSREPVRTLSRRLLAFSAAAPPPASAASSEWEDVRTRSHTRPQIVWFYLPTCPPCKAFAPAWKQACSSEIDVDWLKIDASTAPGRRLADHNAVRSFPTVVRVVKGANATLPSDQRGVAQVVAFARGGS